MIDDDADELDRAVDCYPFIEEKDLMEVCMLTVFA